MPNQSRLRRLSPHDARTMRALLRLTVKNGASEAEAMAAYAARNCIREKYGCKPLGRPPVFAAQVAADPSLTPQEWVKPKPGKGYEWRQCRKPTCHCMRGGRWHGPYAYHKKRVHGAVKSKYLGKQKVAA
jgi:hypothetical protein